MKNKEFIPLVISYLDNNHTVKLPLRGYSMRPFLEDNRDVALLTKVNNPKVGEPVLALLPDERWVLHRIIKIEGDDVTMLGDGNLTPEYCKMSDIKASVIGFYRKGRDKMDYINGRKWKIYSYFWTRMYPLRKYLLFIYRRFLL